MRVSDGSIPGSAASSALLTRVAVESPGPQAHVDYAEGLMTMLVQRFGSQVST
uniref:Uncharacterized protein n=1 Tax=Arundo donax TaxID=35708 RepID=A0A0A9H7T1_ARUDO